MNPKLIKISGYLGLFLVVTGLSYFLFDYFLPANKSLLSTFSSKIKKEKQVEEVAEVESFYPGPKTQICPLNGKMYTKEEEAIWSDRRPLMVMIENHEDSRPQSGIQTADIVYEAIAEGGITRFMAVFYCGQVAGSEYNRYDLGPVRSARTYFLDIASEYSDYPLYNHVGGANCSAADSNSPCTTNVKAQAIEQITAYDWNDRGTWSDLSQFALSYKVCRREPERTGEVRATEHTMYCSSKELWDLAADRGLTNMTEVNKTSWDKEFRSWLINGEDKAVNEITAQNVTFDFWSGYKDYSVTWKYDQANNVYLRQHGDQQQIDFNNKENLSSKNIVLQFVKETRSVDEHLHNLYQMIGKGTGVLIQNGQKIDITWAKANRISRTIFKDKKGKEIKFVPGNIWVEVLPTGTDVTYN
jgi:Protein of unknown function (DUF3048) N-terminal domain/Protein of unknown function (DUF3048) C-terminal domain